MFVRQICACRDVFEVAKFGRIGTNYKVTRNDLTFGLASTSCSAKAVSLVNCEMSNQYGWL